MDPQSDDNVVEIGPGLGALTRPLLERVKRLTVIEIDRDLAARIGAEFAPDRLTLHTVDALSFDFATLGGDLRIIGNLPYNISSPLLFHLSRYEASLRDLTVMLQREVVQRMVAAPATSAYGRLTVMLQVRFRIERLFTVPSGAFRPAPKVESAVARLAPLGAAGPGDRRRSVVRGGRRRRLRTAAQDPAQCATALGYTCRP